jgi:hypothetical protein
MVGRFDLGDCLRRHHSPMAARQITVAVTDHSRRRFPPPWDIEEYDRRCFIVKDKNGQALVYVYFEDELGRRAAANLMMKDEAHHFKPC